MPDNPVSQFLLAHIGRYLPPAVVECWRTPEAIAAFLTGLGEHIAKVVEALEYVCVVTESGFVVYPNGYVGVLSDTPAGKESIRASPN